MKNINRSLNDLLIARINLKTPYQAYWAKQKVFFKKWFDKLRIQPSLNSAYIKINGDCEWMLTPEEDMKNRKVYYQHVR